MLRGPSGDDTTGNASDAPPGAPAGDATVLLSLATMRACDTALAAVGHGTILVRNDRWLELAALGVAAWRPAGPGSRGGAAEPDVIEGVVLQETAALLASDERSRTSRWERGDLACVLEVRVERVRPETETGPPLVLARMTDLTALERERARMRDALIAQERLRAIGEVASGVAHDLNNTLHALTLRLARLRAGALSEDQVTNLGVVERIVGEAVARVRRLQDLARNRQDVPLEAVDLGAVVSNAIAVAERELAGEPRVEVEHRLPRLPAVVGSATELTHVFLNLILNARDAMPSGGRILVDGRQEGDAVVVSVADHGSGIARDHLARVFEPFFTTKGRRGTGLGLSLVAGVMRRLGGAVDAGNAPGAGAVFTLRFPIAPRRAHGPLAAEAEAPPIPMRRVLVVDDDEDNLDAARWVLESLGQRVEVAGSGGDALGRVDAGERYDVVLCDLGMPEMNGWDVTDRLRERLPDACIYIVSGWAEQVPRDDPRRARLDGILPKPLAIPELHRILRGVHGPGTVPAPSGGGPQTH